MADNLSKQGSQDRSRINVGQEHELRYWTKRFGVTEDDLREAVERVGPMADKVEADLRRKAS